MGFLSSLKRLLFVQESLAKSATEKAKDYTVETAETITAKSKDLLHKAEDAISEKLTDIRSSFAESSESTLETVKNTAKEAEAIAYNALEKVSENENVKKAAEFTEQLGDKILTTGEKFMDKISETAEKYRPAGEEALEKAKTVAESVGEKIIEVKNDMVERAKELSSDLGQKLDELTEKAVIEAEELKNTPKKEFSDKTLDAGPSLLEDKDDFFAKAAKYAEGNYSVFESVPTQQKTDMDSIASDTTDAVAITTEEDVKKVILEEKENLPPLVMGDLLTDTPTEEE